MNEKMSLKSELEVLRGEPIEVFTCDLLNIPCIETSDAEKLCKHPVVSVHMITYNHEPYIQQAIEGVMMQKTDFEFELVIGEDCSQDKTREICFEYQKRYPEKIRVLWADVNVNNLGGNGRRTSAHCRGEFIAYCEGDDYWTDPLKLQKQVNAMRANPSVGLCFAQAQRLYMKTGQKSLWRGDAFSSGLMSGRKFFLWLGFGKQCVARELGPESFIMTATVMVRYSVLCRAKELYDIFKWRLLLGDSTNWLGCSSLSDVYFLKEPVAVYRINNGGAMARSGARMTRDGLIVRMYYAVKVYGFNLDDVLDHLGSLYALSVFFWYSEMSHESQRQYFNKIVSVVRLRRLFLRLRTFPAWLAMKWDIHLMPFSRLWICRFMTKLPMWNRRVDPFNKLYDD